MFLIFPRSVIIPEALQRLEDANFDDWLTAALIETAKQPPLKDRYSDNTDCRASGVTDLWMLEIAERTGEVWTGNFQVALTNGDRPYIDNWTEQRSGELSFTLDTRTAEITFQPMTVKSN
jgi:hypothetical protein